MSVAEAGKPRDALASLRIQRSEPLPSGRRWRRWLGRLLGLVIILAVAAGGFFAAEKSGWLNAVEALQPRLEVRVSTVSVQTGRAADATVVATGYLKSRRQAKIGARAPGRIETLEVEEGSRVSKGDLIAALEHADLEASLAAAKAALERSKAEVVEQEVEISRTKREFDRVEKLRPTRTLTETEMDQAKFQYESAVAKLESLKAAVSLAEARVMEAEQTIENMFVRAPFDGTVISKDAELGESIMPGGMGEASGRGSVVTIADLDHLEVDCDVKEDYISRIVTGQAAEVAVDAVPDRRYAGQVRKIIPMGDRARATIKVEVAILDSDARLFPEMSSTVYFLPNVEESASQKDEARIFCATDAIVSMDEGKAVWLVGDEDRLRRVAVETGEENSGRVEILKGLSGGERVVIRPPPELREGQLVKVAE